MTVEVSIAAIWCTTECLLSVMLCVQEYFQLTHNIRLQYPSIIGVRLSHTNAEFPVVVPAELCTVLPEQFFKKRLPNHLTAEVVKFATLKPEQRLEKIMGQAYRGTELESPVNLSRLFFFLCIMTEDKASVDPWIRTFGVCGRIRDASRH